MLLALLFQATPVDAQRDRDGRGDGVQTDGGQSDGGRVGVYNRTMRFSSPAQVGDFLKQIDMVLDKDASTDTEFDERREFNTWNPNLRQFLDPYMREGFMPKLFVNQQAEIRHYMEGGTPETLRPEIAGPCPGKDIKAILNPVNQVIIGDFVIQVVNTKTSIKIPLGNAEAIEAIGNGANPGLFPGVEVINNGTGVVGNDPVKVGGGQGGPSVTDECNASFSFPAVFANSNSGYFTYTGDSGVSSYAWSFGDGNTSTLQNPPHTYAGQGTYTVTLTVVFEDGCIDSYWLPVPVNQGCIAKFNAATTGNTLLVNFTNNSVTTTGYSSILWDLGDGTTSTSPNPNHTYPCNGYYDVTLTIVTGSGCTRSKTKTIDVGSGICCDSKVDKADARTQGSGSQNGGNGWVKYEDKKRYRGRAWERNYWWFGTKYQMKADMDHRKKRFGIWWANKANLSINLSGDVYTDDQLGCTCNHKTNIDQSKSEHKSGISITQQIGENFEHKFQDPWTVVYGCNGMSQTKQPILQCN